MVTAHETSNDVLTRKFFYPEAVGNIIHQSGAKLSKDHKGIEVHVFYRKGYAPHGAEVFNKTGEIHAEIGLWWEVNELVDYDGVFELPDVLAKALREMGLIIPKDISPE